MRLEFLTVKCQTFYLLWDFAIVIVAVVYIGPSPHAKANTNEALGGLHDAISELLTKHPDSFVVVAGDFNHISYKCCFPQVQASKLLTFKLEERTCWTWCIQTPKMHTRQRPTPTLATLFMYLSCWCLLTNQD